MIRPRFARHVVDEVMARLGHNVNIMDTAGVIIASGEPVRLGTVHDGARRALEGATTVVVTEADAAVLRGSLPGVNVPIRVDGEVVGVVGVTGPPHRVEAAAASVALTVELMLEHEATQEEGQWRQRARAQLVEDLVTGRLDEAEWHHRLELVGCRAQPPYALLALALDGAPPLVAARRHLDVVDPGVLVALDVDDVVWVVAGHRAHALARGQLDRTRAALLRHGVAGRSLDAGAAGSFAELVPLAARTRLASRCGWAGDRTLADLELPVLLAGLDDGTRRRAAARLLGGLTREQRATLRAFLDADLVVARAARDLLVHRNTLLQRLDAITRRTGRDPRRFTDAAALHAALLMEEQTG